MHAPPHAPGPGNRRVRRITVALLTLLAATCGTPPSGPGPVPEGPAIQSISPNTGPTSGGTEVTIRGAGFAAGMTVTIGGRPATDVNVRASDMVTARTPSSPTAGPEDVTASLSGRTASLPAGFRYETTAPNTAPTIRSISAQGRRLREPANFADYGETIQMTLVVEDAESTPAQLVYEWRAACGGTFNGAGPQVEWTAPAIGSFASTCAIDVAVLDGPHLQTRSVVIRLHNSIAEMATLALTFLNEFADSRITAEDTVRHFSDTCRAGKSAELTDIQENRTKYRINSHTYGEPAVTINFGSVCAFRARFGDACVSLPVEWRSTRLETGAEEVAKGISRISGIYENSRWWLCYSDLQESPGSSIGFMH